jgi:hypothetical protein
MLEWLAQRKNTVQMILVYRSGSTSVMRESRVKANTLAGAQRELERTWLSSDVVGVRIVRFGGELSGWYAREV